MEKHEVGKLVSLQCFVAGFNNYLGNQPQNSTLRLQGDQHELILRNIKALAEIFKKSDLPVSSAWTELALVELDKPLSTDGVLDISGQPRQNLLGALRNLADNVGHELSVKLYISISSRRAVYWDPTEPLFGVQVALKFPSLSYDIEEAGKCLAVERSTAAVFHSIRCLEAGVRAIARCLGIPDPITGVDRSWGTSFAQLKTKLTDDGRSILQKGCLTMRNSSSGLTLLYTP